MIVTGNLSGSVDGPHDRVGLPVTGHGTRLRDLHLHEVRHQLDLRFDHRDDGGHNDLVVGVQQTFAGVRM